MSGLHKKDDTYLYVTEGAVGWGPRMRLLSTTEYTLIVLRSPEVGLGVFAFHVAVHEEAPRRRFSWDEGRGSQNLSRRCFSFSS